MLFFKVVKLPMTCLTTRPAVPVNVAEPHPARLVWVQMSPDAKGEIFLAYCAPSRSLLECALCKFRIDEERFSYFIASFHSLQIELHTCSSTQRTSAARATESLPDL